MPDCEKRKGPDYVEEKGKHCWDRFEMKLVERVFGASVSHWEWGKFSLLEKIGEGAGGRASWKRTRADRAEAGGSDWESV
jgi:hypothetical protein